MWAPNLCKTVSSRCRISLLNGPMVLRSGINGSPTHQVVTKNTSQKVVTGRRNQEEKPDRRGTMTCSFWPRHKAPAKSLWVRPQLPSQIPSRWSMPVPASYSVGTAALAPFSFINIKRSLGTHTGQRISVHLRGLGFKLVRLGVE